MNDSYRLTCSYRVGRAYCKRTLKRNLPLKDARDLQARCQAREISRVTAKRGHWSSWTGRIYGISLERKHVKTG